METTPAFPPQTMIDVSGLPDPVVRSIRQLVDSLRHNGTPAPEPGPRPSLLGLFDHLGYSFPKESLDADRKEVWAGFPRDFPEPEQL